MDGTARFLLGGALGAALGYLLSQKNLEKARQEGVQPSEAGGSPVNVPEHDPQFRGSVAPAPPAVDWSIPPAPSTAWHPSPAPAAATPAGAPVDSPPGVPSPSEVADAPMSREPAESEIRLTRDFLDEPVPGSGWRPASAGGVEEATLESASGLAPDTAYLPLERNLGQAGGGDEAGARGPAPAEWAAEEAVAELPVVEEETELPMAEETVSLPLVEDRVADTVALASSGAAAAFEAAMATEGPSYAGSSPTGTSARVDDLKSRIEETRRRIRHELEQPFDTAATSQAPEREWPARAAAPQVEGATPVGSAQSEPAPTEEIAAEPLAIEPLAIEEVAIESVEIEELTVEAIPVESSVAEPVFEPAAGGPVAAPMVAEPAPAPPAEGQAVAETPTASAIGEPVGAEPAVTEPTIEEEVRVETLPPEVLAAEPATAEPVVTEPAVAEPVAAEPEVVEAPVGQRSVAESLELAATTIESVADKGVDPEQPVDYDSMKGRIETTRSRLKAKAFDAMMTGESALLGRDLGGTEPAPRKMPGVDSDIDETIETNLREEED